MKGFLKCVTMTAILFFLLTPAHAQGDPWQWKSTLRAGDLAANREFGLSVSLDGDQVAVGAHRDDTLAEDAGAVYVYRRNGEIWQLEAKLYAGDAEASSGFGATIHLQGDRLAVGAPIHFGGANHGAAYLFERIGGTWTQVDQLDTRPACCFFGSYVRLDGDRLAVGASWEHHSGTVRTGAVYLYERMLDGSWPNVARVQAESPGQGDFFGDRIDLDGDRMLIGANSNPWGHDPLDSGAAYLFERQIDGTWLQRLKLQDTDPPFVDQFGSAVALEGNRMMIGARGHESEASPGTVYVYELDDSGTWQEAQRIQGEVDGDEFGFALDFEGERAVIAARLRGPGAVYTYRHDTTQWQQVSIEEAPDGVSGDYFGHSVGLDGDQFAAGAILAADSAGNPKAGAVYHFEFGGPLLWAPHRKGAAGEIVSLPIHLSPHGEAIAGTAFSLDYDESCLFFDATDDDADGMPDGIRFSLPAGMVGTALVDLGDTDGEIDMAVAGAFATLPDGPFATVDFLTTCTPETGGSIVAPVAFGEDPAPSFSNPDGQSVPGSDEDGSIEILPGARGDCNADGVIDVADMVSCELEVFDDDGTDWLDVPGSTFVGDPVGCDANADQVIDVGDLTCKNRLIFGLECGAAGGGLLPEDEAYAPVGLPTLVLPDALKPDENGLATVIVSLHDAEQSLSAVLFGLRWDPARLSVDDTDADGDGLPDSVRFVGSPTSTRRALLDSESGRLRILNADLIASPRPLAGGPLLEIQVRVTDPDPARAPFAFATEPAASFGTADGRSVEGRTVVGNPLFADGFESGGTERWSVPEP